MNCRRKTGDFLALSSTVLPVSLSKKRFVSATSSYFSNTKAFRRFALNVEIYDGMANITFLSMKCDKSQSEKYV